MVWHGEAASSHLQAAEEFATKFLKTMTSEGYFLEQFFSCNETNLFWKWMPKRAFITQEETKMPGQKPIKDHLTLLFLWKCMWGSEAASTQPVVAEIVSQEWSMGLEVSEEGVMELVESDNIKLSTEDLVALQQEDLQGV
ncbi:hypothetical protein JRQ81_015007 [Phrynocephalus forsythii]|uniref:Uncharacterized protein n=1 Tax=Phrynocephalus forsythii TaxID=171643 RepID=A0A9Q0XYG6_9SAUR|nr:hypothetical protein JRQ81_015007 [Phrynocephalus forsythii]